MKMIFLTGSHPRHLYVAKKLYDEHLLSGLLIEVREEFMPVPDDQLSPIDRQNFERHFLDRQTSEERFFGSLDSSYFSGIPVYPATKENLNDEQTRQWIQNLQPDIAVSYGIHKLNEDMLASLPAYAWNIHGGLSPWYRGNTTLFWPFYFLKPNWTGMTIHKLTSKLDGGGIIHHSVPVLERGDGIHDVACKAVIQASEDLIKLLQLVSEGLPIHAVPQKSNGKLFTSADWRPQHLRMIYNTFNNDIVDQYLDGKLEGAEPKLIKAF
ncbi:formyltransferase family protein [Paenibacillus sepulcri]|uniref:Methionyl-tRNA formyltransferase n=1 Tax=Paenibacillus sepulcri TaxID=359917 RepID=A0ABS7C5M5_9BACL|nr:methionyl-tRNA formyltransferase [Paenibacillus sepulcri]